MLKCGLGAFRRPVTSLRLRHGLSHCKAHRQRSPRPLNSSKGTCMRFVSRPLLSDDCDSMPHVRTARPAAVLGDAPWRIGRWAATLLDRFRITDGCSVRWVGDLAQRSAVIGAIGIPRSWIGSVPSLHTEKQGRGAQAMMTCGQPTWSLLLGALGLHFHGPGLVP